MGAAIDAAIARVASTGALALTTDLVAAVARRAAPVVLGVAAGSLTLALVIGGLLVSGAAAPLRGDFDAALLRQGFVAALVAAPFEEWLFRGVLQKRLTARWDATRAIAASGALFAAAHLANPGAGWQSFGAVFVLSCLLFGVLYQRTKSVASCIAAHFAWNFLLYGALGGTMSGIPSAGRLALDPAASHWLTGGDFGIEASVFTPLAAAATGLLVSRWTFARKPP